MTAVRPDDTAGTARPLYWCPHWTTLNEMPCDTCLGEGPQAAYYRADDYERLRNLVSGGNCIRDDKDGLSPCERAVARAERAERERDEALTDAVDWKAAADAYLSDIGELARASADVVRTASWGGTDR